jgi:hypothetical protein
LTSEPTLPQPAGTRAPRPWHRLVLVAAALLALFAVVALVSRAHRGEGGRGAGPPKHFLDYFLSAYLALGVILGALVLWALLTQQDRPRTRKKHRDIRQLAVFLIVIGILGVIFGGNKHLLDRLHVFQRGNTTTTGAHRTGTSGSTTTTQDAPGSQREPGWRWAPALLFGGLAVAGLIAYAAVGRGKKGSPDPKEVAEDLASALDDALIELRAEQDPRRAIIAAYARMEQLLAAHGAERKPYEAPFEYLGRVLIELDTSPGAVFELTDLFERAKFSHHTMNREMKDDAIEALVTVRDELRGPR